MTITQTEIGKRLQAIYLDWKKGKPYRGSGVAHFAKELNKSRVTVEKYISGAFHTVPSDVLDALSKMGYNTEWLLHKAGKMKADQSDKMSFTEVTLLRTEVANLRQQLNLTTARLAGVNNELHDLKKQFEGLKNALHKTV